MTSLPPVLKVCEQPRSAPIKHHNSEVEDVDLIAVEVENAEEDFKDKLETAVGELNYSDIDNSVSDNSEGGGGTGLDVVLMYFCAVIQKTISSKCSGASWTGRVNILNCT